MEHWSAAEGGLELQQLWAWTLARLLLGSPLNLDPLRESSCESGEGVRLPRERADLRGSLGNFRGTPENFRGCLGKLPGNLWIAVNFHTERTSGEVTGELPGKVRGTSEDFPEARAIPATRAKLFSNPHPTKRDIANILCLLVRKDPTPLNRAYPLGEPGSYIEIWPFLRGSARAATIKALKAGAIKKSETPNFGRTDFFADFYF